MNSRTSLFSKTIAGAIVSAVLGVASSLCASPLELRGIVVETNGVLVGICNTETGSAFWIEVGSTRHGVRALAYDDATGEVKVGFHDKTVLLQLKRAFVHHAPIQEVASSVPAITQAVIRTTTNPRLFAATSASSASISTPVVPPAETGAAAGVALHQGLLGTRQTRHVARIESSTPPVSEVPEARPVKHSPERRGLNPRLWSNAR